jgi:hypothetical protein
VHHKRAGYADWLPRFETPISVARFAAIAKSRHWLDEVIVGTVAIQQIAHREKCSIRQVNRMITLAFLAPSLVQAAIDGRLPRGIGIESLRECPSEWHEQHRKLGLAP